MNEFLQFSVCDWKEAGLRHLKKIICNASRRSTNASIKDAESDLKDHEILETEVKGKDQS